MPYRAQYIAQARPVWPPSPARMSRNYATIARAIRGANPIQKSAILNAITTELINFDVSHVTHLASQKTYDTWFNGAVGRITAVPFTWVDAGGTAHANLSFGAAQKFLNLGMKDWWAVAPNGTSSGSLAARLHGSLDQIVYSSTSRFCGTLPSLQGPRGALKSYVACLTAADYQTYQNHLADLGTHISAGMHLPRPLFRIEVEQLLWGWI